ncbi:PaaX family transcriptional regulator C-terminal domain-containing protein [Nocardia sp. XZ_19_369]|uniref:PaaX family transcriptional regulator n=1 Tax=Nocardia sp. XZ_19_369 TaxID=2769487 RepID=UPI00188DCE6E|nr:PaaX family transcriptional regulator C-terminal domain-containing protein [Nocardia sp. XZ_19_369]
MNSPRADLAGAVLDDIDSRPGSATSLARTVLGAYVRDLGGWLAIADFSALLAGLGVPEQSTRTAVTRLKSKGVLDAESRDGRSGYRITAAAEAMYSRGDPRIFGFRQMADGDAWHLISFGIPESQRAARHQLRRRLSSIGCGTVSAGLWICPEYLAAEAATIVTALALDDYVTSFRATDLTVPGTLRAAAAQWWDLPTLAERHRAFLAHHGDILTLDNLTDRQAFEYFVPLLDEWRIIPYLDPGLPAPMLPPDWPGPASVRLFAEAQQRCLAPSRRWVRSSIEAGSKPGILIH